MKLVPLHVLVGCLLVGMGTAASAEKDCRHSSMGLIPLTELGTSRYQGVRGGLYPDGRNQRPASHEQAGRTMAQTIEPLDESGRPASKQGWIVLLASGMSNALTEFYAFKKFVRQQRGVNRRLRLVNGARGMATAEVWADPGGAWLAHVRQKLAKAKLSPLQVQVAWLKNVRRSPGEPFPMDAVALKRDLVQIVQLLKQEFPNLKLAYLSSRTYGGYAKGVLNPEPYAYHSGFAVKWLIEEQLRGNRELNFDSTKGPVKAPWLSWGPYLWADGVDGRGDGLMWGCDDFADDGTHPSDSGKEKVAQLLWEFFTTDTTTNGWFLGGAARR